jgi:hypothetical protein
MAPNSPVAETGKIWDCRRTSGNAEVALKMALCPSRRQTDQNRWVRQEVISIKVRRVESRDQRKGRSRFETNAFSEKVKNHAAAVAFHFIHHNFARVHKTLQITPAMAACISDPVWSYEEIAALAS